MVMNGVGTSNGNGTPIDHLYLKNVLLKFVVAATQGQIEQVSAPFPQTNSILKASYSINLPGRTTNCSIPARTIAFSVYDLRSSLKQRSLLNHFGIEGFP